MTNEELYEKALEAIHNLFGDTGVSQATTKRQLNALIGEIEVMIDSMKSDDAE